jgi:acetylornithine/N-succinyldiaminopimelate aminotransferase
MSDEHLMHTYARLPVCFERGSGAWLWDTEGRRYLDALGGVAVCALGHAHPDITAAIREQAGLLLHTSNLYQVRHQQALGDRLTRLSGMDRAFFCNSGAEANEAAIKIARRYAAGRDIAQPKIIVMEGSFHGRTLATLSATGNAKVQQGFGPLVAGFLRVPYDNLPAVEALAGDKDIVAILVEPVQGEGGINIPAQNYLAGLRKLCDRNGWLLMLDEIQSGTGRTGHWFAFQHSGILPDVLTCAKALGNGVPIGVCLARGAAAEVLQPGSHGTTFGGNPLATRAALAVLDVIERDGLLARAAALGERMLEGFRRNLGRTAGVKGIRGLGLLLGVELDRDCGELVKQALAEGLLINVTAGRVVRLLPPYILTDTEADRIVEGVSALIRRFTGTSTERTGT